MDFYSTYPHCPAAKSLDAILIEEDELNYSSKIHSIIHSSFLLFKEVKGIKSSSKSLILSLCYQERCRVVDQLKVSQNAKTHIKNIIYSGCRKYIPGSKTYQK